MINIRVLIVGIRLWVLRSILIIRILARLLH